jgi:hypothetical protein
VGTLSHTRDLGLFNCVAKEINRLAGMIGYYYRLDKVMTRKSATYNEANDLVFRDEPPGLRFSMFAEKPEHQLSTSDEGRRKEYNGTAWIARADWEEQVKDGTLPKSGDLVNLWGEFYDITDTGRDGVLDDDRNVYTLHKLTIRRTSKYEPWRRLHDKAAAALEGA